MLARADDSNCVGQRLGLPHGEIDDFHDIVDANVVLALLVQKNDLIGREPPHAFLGEANLDETLACRADSLFVVGPRI